MLEVEPCKYTETLIEVEHIHNFLLQVLVIDRMRLKH